jgi:hypothetical protein
MESGAVGPYLMLRDPIEWSALVLSLAPPAGWVGGLLLRTRSEIAFAPRRRFGWRRRIGWVLSRDSILEVRRLHRLERPFGRLPRANRVAIISTDARHVLSGFDPDELITSLAS